MQPTYAQVLEATHSHIGDTDVAGGQITDAALVPHLTIAYASLLSRLRAASDRLVLRTSYYTVSAYQSALKPSAAGWSNFGSPCEIWDRAVSSSVSVTGATPGTSYCDLIVASHSIENGTNVVVTGVNGLDDMVNDMWTITAPDSATVRLMGCVVSGAWTSGGTITTSGEDFPATPLIASFDSVYPTLASTLGSWSWENGLIRFQPCATDRQVKVRYFLSSTIPTNLEATIPIDDSYSFLSHYTAAHFLAVKGADKGLVANLYIQACGNSSGDVFASPSAGFLHGILNTGTKSLQHARIQMGPFRPRRNTGPSISF